MGNQPNWNNIFAAILLACLVAMLSGFIAKKVVAPHTPETTALAIAESAPAASTTAEAPKGPNPITPLMASADAVAGQKVARACAACHSFDKGGANKVGPNLWGIVGNKHAHLDNFNYSDALKAMHDKPWDYEELSHFLYNPKGYLKGTKMVFAGVKDDKQRADLLAYLRSLSDSPVPLP